MRINSKLHLGLMVLLMILMLTGCSAGKERYELTKYMGRSVASFEKKTGVDLEEQSNGVYVMENVVQAMALDGEVTAVTLLKEAGDYTIFGVGIGMNKAEAEQKLQQTFGKEISKTINSSNNSITYSYRKDSEELYADFDIDLETVAELSYYKLKGSKTNENTVTDVNEGELIAVVGDIRIYYNEAMVYLKSAQENYESEYGKDIWKVDIFGDNSNFGSLIKEEVMKQMIELKIIRKQAENLGISLSEEEWADARAYAQEHYSELTDQDISKYFVSHELLEQIYADNLLAEKVFETTTINVNTFVSDLEAKQITVWDILIYGVDFDEEGNTVPLSLEEKDQVFDKVKTLYEKAKTTEDFYSLAEANSEAERIEYTFGRGQAPSEYSRAFELAAFNLKTGQVSDIITTDYGWHILYCVSDFNEDATTQVKEKIIDERRSEMFTQLYSEWSAQYDIVINSEAWDTITFEE